MLTRKEEKMKNKKLFSLLVGILIALLLSGCYELAMKEAPSSRMIDPIVSTDWLSTNSHVEDLVIIDIRDPGSYAAGHIPGSINEPFVKAFDPCKGPSSNWIIGTKDCLWLELPDENDLFNTIGSLGITRYSRVVIVTAPNPKEPPFFGLANATRVADTLIYAGIKSVAVLDGGYPKWVAEGRPTAKQATTPNAVKYKGETDKAMFVPIDYVKKQIGKAVIIDTRDTFVYFGASVEPFAKKAGHIPSAKSLPAPWIWDLNADNGAYIYKDSEMLRAVASGVLGPSADPKSQEIIVYCGVGGYTSSWWFVLTQVLGYQNVKFYDGSAQEWVIKYDMVM
jgi:thiosulfate/3-mercaptopyruvate sulfurtransferase